MPKLKFALLLSLAALPMATAFAAPSPAKACKANFRQFVVDREPKGYPINKATLTVVGYGSCRLTDAHSVSTKEAPFDVEFVLKDTDVDVYDLVAKRHTRRRSLTTVDVSYARKLARISNNDLVLNVEVPIEVQGGQVAIHVDQPPVPVFGPSAPPAYELRKGSELLLAPAK